MASLAVSRVRQRQVVTVRCMHKNKLKLLKQRFRFNMRLLILILFFLASCDQHSGVSFRQNKNDSTEQVAVYSSKDENINAAIAQARQSFPLFLDSFKNQCEGCTGFAVKMRFRFGDDSGEHIWLNNLFFNKERLFGVVANDPENIEQLKFGDTVEVEKASLSDWKYVQNGKLTGGYTVKLAYDNSDTAGKKQLEEGIGAKIK